MPDDSICEDALRARLETQGVTLDAAVGETLFSSPRSAGLKLAPVRLRDRGDDPTESGADLEVIATLGEGGMGVVHLARPQLAIITYAWWRAGRARA